MGGVPGAIGVTALCGAAGNGVEVVGGIDGDAGVPGGRPGGGPLIWDAEVLGAFGVIAPEGAIGGGGTADGPVAGAAGS